jgi:hypothetical protein
MFRREYATLNQMLLGKAYSPTRRIPLGSDDQIARGPNLPTALRVLLAVENHARLLPPALAPFRVPGLQRLAWA